MKVLSRKQPKGMNVVDWKELEANTVSTIIHCLVDKVMYHVMVKESPVAIWLKLGSRYMSKSQTNKLLLKKRLYGIKMAEGLKLDQHINVSIRSSVICDELM